MRTYLFTYDVSTEDKEGQKRLRKVAQACLDYGIRVQKSIFECSLSEKHYTQLLGKLLDCIDQEKDSLRIYRLTDPAEKNVEAYGLKPDSIRNPSDVIII
jgi:CRISPR-associated protein Cas2